MSEPIRLLLIGAGNRGADAYGAYALTHPDVFRFTAVAEPILARRLKFAQEHQIPSHNQFTDYRHALAAHPDVDAVVNATQDELHYDSALAVIAAGYPMLLEKPIAPSWSETLEIVQAAEVAECTLLVSHVLRYTPFFRKIHDIIQSGRLGQIIHLSQSENVSYFHMAHSYVRGHWRSTRLAAPMILAKCSHDLDLIYWWMGEKVKTLSSFGGLRHFITENAPTGAPARCMDGCPAADVCPFYAPRIYLDARPIKIAVSKTDQPILRAIGKLSLKAPQLANALGRIIPPLRALTQYQGWPVNTITQHPEDPEAIRDALQHGPYGRCVYHCDNDVADHQVVSMLFPSGVTATLTMQGHSHEEGRTVRIDASRATLLGKFSYSEAWIDIHEHLSGAVERFRFPSEVEQTSGHGGGDGGLMQHFARVLRGEATPLTSARDSLESHRMAFGAEKARKSLGTVSLDDAFRVDSD